MRRSLSKLTALGTALLFGVFMAACEGPQGPAGEDGVDGVDGVDGQDGQDANENCVQCHFEDTDLVAKQVQYLNSVHYTGGHFELGSYSATCAGCHSHEGFIDRMESGQEGFIDRMESGQEFAPVIRFTPRTPQPISTANTTNPMTCG